VKLHAQLKQVLIFKIAAVLFCSTGTK